MNVGERAWLSGGGSAAKISYNLPLPHPCFGGKREGLEGRGGVYRWGDGRGEEKTVGGGRGEGGRMLKR